MWWAKLLQLLLMVVHHLVVLRLVAVVRRLAILRLVVVLRLGAHLMNLIGGILHREHCIFHCTGIRKALGSDCLER